MSSLFNRYSYFTNHVTQNQTVENFAPQFTITDVTLYHLTNNSQAVTFGEINVTPIPPMNKNPIIGRMPPDMLEAYLRFEITSFDVAQALGVNPASVRRAIPTKKRVRPESQTSVLKERRVEKQKLREVRKAYRATLAHLPITEIMQKANVSTSLAYKIKKQHEST